MRKREPEVDMAIAAAGGVGALARIAGVQPESIHSWRHIPVARVKRISDALDIKPHVLRPDLRDLLCPENQP